MQYLQLYSLNGVTSGMPLPIETNSAPTVNDTNAVPGQLWINITNGSVYQFGGTVADKAIWTGSALRFTADAATSKDAAVTANSTFFVVAISNLNTASTESGTITITNSYVTATSSAIIGASITGPNNPGYLTQRVTPAAGTMTIKYVNTDADAFEGGNVLYLTVQVIN